MLLRHLGFLQDLKKPSKFIKNLQKGKNANVLITIKKQKLQRKTGKLSSIKKKTKKNQNFEIYACQNMIA